MADTKGAGAAMNNATNENEAHNSGGVAELSPRPAPERWGDPPPPEHDPFETVESSFEEVKRLIGWLEFVGEAEYTLAEKRQLCAVAARFAKAAQPIASKYCD